MNDADELSEHVRVFLREKTEHGFVAEPLAEITLSQHQIQRVLTVGFLDQLELFVKVRQRLITWVCALHCWGSFGRTCLFLPARDI